MPTTVTFDAASNSGYQAASAGYSWSHTCSGTQRALVVAVGMLAPGQTVTGITYNGVALTLVNTESLGGVGRLEFWQLLAPATGAHTIAVTLSGSVVSASAAVSATGVGDIGNFAAEHATNGVAADDATVDVTTLADNALVIGAVVTTDGSVTVGAGQTSRANVTGAAGSIVASTEPVPTAGTVNTFFSGIGALQSWIIGALSLERGLTPPTITDPTTNPKSLSFTEGDPETLVGGTLYSGTFTGDDPDDVSFTGPDAGSISIITASSGVFGLTVNSDLSPGSYDFTLNLSNAGGSASQQFLVTVISTVTTITSDGGGSTASINVSENTTAVTTVVASGTAPITFAKTGGADQAKFSLNTNTGALAFLVAPDFETPTDANLDNGYVVEVTASGPNGTDIQTITAHVVNVNEPPTITSNGGGGVASINFPENCMGQVTQVQASSIFALTYSLDPASPDYALFVIDSVTGVISPNPANNNGGRHSFDYENPTDADANGIYELTALANTVNNGSDSQDLSITITNVGLEVANRSSKIGLSIGIGVGV